MSPKIRALDLTEDGEYEVESGGFNLGGLFPSKSKDKDDNYLIRVYEYNKKLKPIKFKKFDEIKPLKVRDVNENTG